MSKGVGNLRLQRPSPNPPRVERGCPCVSVSYSWRGHRPNGFRGLRVPPRMVEDLLLIAQLPREALDQLVTSLESAIGFLNEEGLKQLVQDTIRDEKVVDAVLGALRRVAKCRRDECCAFSG
jgi:hypothetical protein